MKIWLLLAFLAVAAATSARQNRTQKKPPRWQKPCIGCYTLLGEPVQALAEPGPYTIQGAEPSKGPPLPGRRVNNGREATLSLLEPRKLAPLQAESPNARRTKREEKRSSLVRRRGKQRSSSRPVCRGCYSGLMIVAPPVHTSNNSFIPVLESHSESGWDSSEEEYLPRGSRAPLGPGIPPV